MTVRNYHPSDKPLIAEIHAEQQLDYRMIDLDNPWVVAASVCEEDGKIMGAAVLKMEAETYLFIRPNAPAAVKWDAVRLLQRHLLRQAIALGIEQLVAYVPSCVKQFAKRLTALGWTPQRDGWCPWSFSVPHQDSKN